MPSRKRFFNDDSDLSADEKLHDQSVKKRQYHLTSEENENSAPSANRKRSQNIEIYSKQESIPTRDSQGCLYFRDFPDFRPNLTPKEVLQLGSFGGTYFRVIRSGVTGETYHNAWKEFPTDWFEGLKIEKWVASQNYDQNINTYKVSCGGDLFMWESSGWIKDSDPFGWFQWYCRFYLGRRCSDDERQIGRALGVMGPTGRWRRNLTKKILSDTKSTPMEQLVDDVRIAPKVRQLLQHWAYKLTLKDLQAAAKRL